ncbi:MAG: hypothetical protein PVG11_04690, partial [Anaerolineae bacterium]
MSRDTLTDTAGAQPQQNKRLRFAILAACLTFCCTVIVGRLVYYQVARGAELKQVSAVQRIREKELPTRRGLIADVNGHVLALDAVEWTIEASPPLVTDAEEAAGALSALLGMPREALYERLTAERPWTRLAMGVDYDTGEAIRALELYGIKCIPTYKRLYPEAGLTAHLLGIVNNTGDGFYGVEGYYNLILKGEPGRRV